MCLLQVAFVVLLLVQSATSFATRPERTSNHQPAGEFDSATWYSRTLNEPFGFFSRIFPSSGLDAGLAGYHRNQRNDEESAFWSRMGMTYSRLSPFPFRHKKDPGTLILVRHGKSEGEASKIFTGWSDEDLSSDGITEMEHAARLLLESGFDIDVVDPLSYCLPTLLPEPCGKAVQAGLEAKDAIFARARAGLEPAVRTPRNMRRSPSRPSSTSSVA